MASITVLNRCILAVGTLVASSIYHFGGLAIHNRQGIASHSATKNMHRSALAEKDRITHLPGLPRVWNKPNFEQFSGYLQAADGRHVFYWYVESQSNPDQDPVVFWTNGGPGCSGLFGFGTEHGPFLFDGSGKVRENPFSWNKHASILYVEQPAGVGFSFTDSEEDIVTGDAQVAEDNYNLILDFFDKFPERRSNSFHIASESYGGHYIPQLALKILHNSNVNSDAGFINFKGFMVGNPYVELYSNLITQFEMYYSHGLLAKPLFDEWKRICKSRQNFLSMECHMIMKDMFAEFDSDAGVNPYGLDYPVCLDESQLDESQRQDEVGYTAPTAPKKVASAQTHTLMDRRSSPPFLSPMDNYRPCAELYLTNFLNKPEVRAALHVQVEESYKWQGCGGVEYNDDDVSSSVIPLYKKLVSMAVEGQHDLNMLIYSGDDDSVCSTAGTQDWIWDLGVNADPSFTWQPWKANGQTAGFVTNFDLGNQTSASLTFATVHGAGHEVPAFRPMEALELLRRYFDGGR